MLAGAGYHRPTWARLRIWAVVWLEQAGRTGWVALTKDDAIRRRPVELQALAAPGVRAFCLTNAT